MAQFVALAASIASIMPGLAKPSNKEGHVSARSTISLPTGFPIGLALGASLSAVALHYIKRDRIKERVRFQCRNLLLRMKNEDDGFDKDHDTKMTAGNNTDSSIQTGKSMEFQTYGESSISEILLNANNALSSHLHCSKITLKPGTALASRLSPAVEIYFVLSGSGCCHRGIKGEGDYEECNVGLHDHVIIQPWVMRSIINRSAEDLIFLRITDDSSFGNYDAEDAEKVVSLKNPQFQQFQDAAVAFTDFASDFKSSISMFGEWMSTRMNASSRRGFGDMDNTES